MNRWTQQPCGLEPIGTVLAMQKVVGSSPIIRFSLKHLALPRVIRSGPMGSSHVASSSPHARRTPPSADHSIVVDTDADAHSA